MNDRQLRYFVKVAEIGSLTGAAGELNVAQPALGLQIKQLEEDIGAPLFERHSRGVTVTEAGQLLYRRSVEILRNFDEAKQELQDFISSDQKNIRLGATASILSLLGPDFLVDARKAMPSINLNLTEGLSYVLVDSLLDGQLDAALAFQSLDRPDFSVTALMEEDLVAVSASSFEQNPDPISFHELSQRELVLAGERDIVRTCMEETARRLHLPINVTYETQSARATINLVKQGIACTVFPYGIVAADVEEGTLNIRPIVRPNVTRTLYLLGRNRGALFRREKEFNEYIDRILTDLLEILGSRARPTGLGRRR